MYDIHLSSEYKLMRSLVLLLILLLLPVDGNKLLRRRDYDADRVLGAEAMTKPDQEHRSLGKGGKDNSGVVIEGCRRANL